MVSELFLWKAVFYLLILMHCCVIAFLYFYDKGKYKFTRKNVLPQLIMICLMIANYLDTVATWPEF